LTWSRMIDRTYFGFWVAHRNLRLNENFSRKMLKRKSHKPQKKTRNCLTLFTNHWASSSFGIFIAVIYDQPFLMNRPPVTLFHINFFSTLRMSSVVSLVRPQTILKGFIAVCLKFCCDTRIKNIKSICCRCSRCLKT